MNPQLYSAAVSTKFETTLCLEIQLITSLNCNLSLNAKLLSTFQWFDLPCWLPLVFLRRNYVNADVCVNWQCWRQQFSTIFFYKKQYLTDGHATYCNISHKHDTKKWRSYTIHRVILTCLGGAVFFRKRWINETRDVSKHTVDISCKLYHVPKKHKPSVGGRKLGLNQLIKIVRQW